MWFDIVPQESLSKKVTKYVVIHTSGFERHHLTLAVIADGNILASMVIFKGKTNRMIRDVVVPEEFKVSTQEKASIDKERMLMWLQEIWIYKAKSRRA